jgi:hypothetical protein
MDQTEAIVESMEVFIRVLNELTDQLEVITQRVKDCETNIVSLAAAVHSHQAVIELAVLPQE